MFDQEDLLNCMLLHRERLVKIYDYEKTLAELKLVEPPDRDIDRINTIENTILMLKKWINRASIRAKEAIRTGSSSKEELPFFEFEANLPEFDI